MEQKPSYRPSSEVFAAYFSGEISSEERLALDHWVAASEANSVEFEQLKLVWQDLGALHQEEVEVDMDAAFQQVKQKKEVLTRSTSGFAMWKVAAAILLLVSVSWWIWKPSVAPITVASVDKQEINLSDGSIVTLNERATLTYLEAFTADERGLQLQGEAYFSVAEEINRPFRIQAGPVTVTVLGTEFSVNATEKSVEVSVSSGRVEVSSDFMQEAISGGSSVLVNLEEESYALGTNSFSGTEFYWVDQALAFEGVALRTVFAELKSIFNAEIEVSNKAILDCRLQARFQGQTLDEIVQIIALSQGLEVSQEGGNYLLTGEGCDY